MLPKSHCRTPTGLPTPWRPRIFPPGFRPAAAARHLTLFPARAAFPCLSECPLPGPPETPPLLRRRSSHRIGKAHHVSFRKFRHAKGNQQADHRKDPQRISRFGGKLIPPLFLNRQHQQYQQPGADCKIPESHHGTPSNLPDGPGSFSALQSPPPIPYAPVRHC